MSISASLLAACVHKVSSLRASLSLKCELCICNANLHWHFCLHSPSFPPIIQQKSFNGNNSFWVTIFKTPHIENKLLGQPHVTHFHNPTTKAPLNPACSTWLLCQADGKSNLVTLYTHASPRLSYISYMYTFQWSVVCKSKNSSTGWHKINSYIKLSPNPHPQWHFQKQKKSHK